MEIIKENILYYDEILKLIEKYDTIVIYRHELPDFDASGTQHGLASWLRDSFPNKIIYTVGKDFEDFTPSLFPKNDDIDVTTSISSLNIKGFFSNRGRYIKFTKNR